MGLYFITKRHCSNACDGFQQTTTHTSLKMKTQNTSKATQQIKHDAAAPTTQPVDTTITPPTNVPALSTMRPGASDAALQRTAEAQDQKLMVVAICRGRDGQLVITPIDVEHDTDDLTPMTDDQMAARKLSDQTYRSVQGDMMKALGALYEIFSRRLYRNQFRTFENFCFAMYGTVNGG